MPDAFLDIESSEGSKRVSLERRLVSIGRSSENSLPIADEKASRKHCVIDWDGKTYVLRDLKSTNGTMVNNQRVATTPLKTGDVIRVGNTTMRFSTPAGPREAATYVDDAPDLNAAEKPERPPAAQRSNPEVTVPLRPSASKPPPAIAKAQTPPPPKAPTPAPPRKPAEKVPTTPAPEEEYDPLRDILPPAKAAEPEPEDVPLHDENGDPAQLPLVDSGSPLDAFVAPASRKSDERSLLDMVAEGSVAEYEVELLNARGDTVHAAGNEPVKIKRKPGDPTAEIAEGVRLVRCLALACVNSRATDVHFEPKAEDYVARLRIDGMMVEAARMDKATAHRIVGVIKVLSDIDIAQRNAIQEGHFSTHVPAHARGGERRIDYRVSFTPSMFGQKLVLRVLDLANAPKNTGELMLPDWMLGAVRKVSRQDQGMVLVAGPTGSGKTTTLYSVLRDIDVHQRNVITIEDPVEYQIEGVTQIPVDEHKGNNFATLLRSILRQDPDVILLGEVRDKETAQTAMQAAMTGHLVLSTVHAKDTIGTVFRLLDLGVEPYLVAAGLNLVISQRLVRLLCPHCKEGKKPSPQQTMRMGRAVEGMGLIYYPVGCPRCLNTGYAGRRGIYELLSITDDLRDVILKTPTIQAIKEEIQLSGFVSLQQSGFRLVADGVTSIEEIERVTGSE